jgi:hypothetical protein
MQASQLNARFVQPFVDVQYITVLRNDDPTVTRGAQVYSETITSSTLTLPWTPSNPNWVEVYVDGFRMVNASYNFGETRNAFTISNKVISFSGPVDGLVQVINDRFFRYDFPEDNYIRVSNSQGAKTKNTVPGNYLASYFCEPVVLTQPYNGFARLTDDRKSVVYVPNYNFVGQDTFSYTVLSDRGQIAEPKCVYITVSDPNPPVEEEEGGEE